VKDPNIPIPIDKAKGDNHKDKEKEKEKEKEKDKDKEKERDKKKKKKDEHYTEAMSATPYIIIEPTIKHNRYAIEVQGPLGGDLGIETNSHLISLILIFLYYS